MITFTERWKKGKVKGSWSITYEVVRGSLSSYGSEGDEPSYYK